MTAVGIGLPVRDSRASARGAARSTAETAADHASEFVAFYEATVGEVFRYLYPRCGRRAQVAEDLTQEVYLAAVVAARRGLSDDLHLPWLIAVARHKLVDYFRRDERHRRNLHAVGELHGRRDELAQWRDADAHDPLLDALESLPPLQRAALILRHVDGLPVPGVAEGIGRTVRATESILSRGRHALRVRYEEVLDD